MFKANQHQSETNESSEAFGRLSGVTNLTTMIAIKTTIFYKVSIVLIL
jgi:hypothetical protein